MNSDEQIKFLLAQQARNLEELKKLVEHIKLLSHTLQKSFEFSSDRCLCKSFNCLDLSIQEGHSRDDDISPPPEE